METRLECQGMAGMTVIVAEAVSAAAIALTSNRVRFAHSGALALRSGTSRRELLLPCIDRDGKGVLPRRQRAERVR